MDLHAVTSCQVKRVGDEYTEVSRSRQVLRRETGYSAVE